MAFHSRVIALAALLAMAVPSASGAQSTGLEDMVGARAGQAEAELHRRGYRNVGGEKGDDRSYTYWWNEDRHQCVSISTMNGHYETVTQTPPPDCHRNASGNDRRSYEADRHGSQAHGYVAGDDLSRTCRNEASARFDRRPSEVTANAPIQQRSGYIVQGWYDPRDGSKGTKFFNCRFDEDGRFLSVN
ncbi:hypothetical protein EDF56_107109 [Novosphingobium sp. PhB165]|uniref:hypothetical protein n=1 Tax=Novosphingobium sp. PhB165 TaxID=2485105 RepID=UPI0010534CA7|nr:hypothetical protein [Novosphingobium sp. PhB165]TCM16530.1 hypothetical protein EDF56_107109 [Novosphingobium sp. PhB165]